jgi:hypothetical protein
MTNSNNNGHETIFHENILHNLCDQEDFLEKDFHDFKEIVEKNETLLFEKNIDGNLPLHYLCFRGTYISSLHKRMFSPPLNKAIEFVLNRHHNLFFEKNNAGETPLHILAYNFFNSETCSIFKKIFDKLLSLDANRQTRQQQIKNSEKNSPLYLLCSLIHINKHATNVILHIIKNNPHLLTIKNNIGNTPLHKLSELFHITDEIDCNINKIFKAIIEKTNISICPMNHQGKIPLHNLIKSKNFNKYTIDNVKLFFQQNVHMVKDGNGDTPLHCMCMNKNFWSSIPEFYKNTRLSSKMINKDGDTPLHILCYISYDQTMNPVLSFFMNSKWKTMKNNKNKTPKEIMMENINYIDFTFIGL